MTRRSKARPKKRAPKAPARVVRAPKVGPADHAPTEAGGRPRIEFDESAIEQIRQLSTFGNTIEDIATLMGVSKSTLERRIADENDPIAIAHVLGKATRHDGLRRAQWANSLRGNATMQIFLGIQELGQRNYKAIEVTGPQGGPIQFGGDELVDLATVKVLELIQSRTKRDRPAAAEGR